jgi:hypothetical protein
MNKRLADLAPVFFFLVLLSIGFIVYKDYGIPWDESSQIGIGTANYNYIFHGDPTLLSIPDRNYGALFELALLWTSDRLLIPKHLLVFLIFFIGSIAFFMLARRLFKSQWWGLLATILLTASPRIFADSFYNSKDIPFLAIAIISMWTLVLLSDALRNGRSLATTIMKVCLHSIASAIMISTRLAGTMIVPLSLLLLSLDSLRSAFPWRTKLALLGGYLSLCAGLTILFWPVLWHGPWDAFIIAFTQMSQFPWERTVLYIGTFFNADKLPWHYLLVWIGISTPLIVLAGFIPGIMDWINIFVYTLHGKGGKKDGFLQALADADWLLWTSVMLWLSIPIAAIYLFHSVLYDGWRQMFFVYPAIVLLSMLGLRSIYRWASRLLANKKIVAICACLLLIAGVAEPVWFMIRYHPYENVYFNVLAGDPSTLRSRFELDYWGLSYKQAIDFILANDSRQQIKINAANTPGFDYINSGLPEAQKSRLIQVKVPAEADYFITEFRWHPENYPYPNKFYSIRVRGTEIMAVYHLAP